MDGNNRWSKKKKINQFQAYKTGADRLINFSNYLFENYSLDYISAFALSKNNLNRSSKILSTLKNVLIYFLDRDNDIKNNSYQIKFIGDLSFLNKTIVNKIRNIENINKSSKKKLIIFLNYSGQSDIINASKKININNQITKINFSKNLLTKKLPDPDLLIRTGGFQRISNFMLFEIAFTELLFTKKLWPDLNITDIDKYIKNYLRIDRKFGR